MTTNCVFYYHECVCIYIIALSSGTLKVQFEDLEHLVDLQS